MCVSISRRLISNKTNMSRFHSPRPTASSGLKLKDVLKANIPFDGYFIKYNTTQRPHLNVVLLLGKSLSEHKIIF